MPSGQEDEPLISSNNDVSYSHTETVSVDPEQVANVTEATQDGGPSVTCRVCEREISLEGRMMNHVVRCGECNEATPIRAAPPGKKYVRCPCHCLLICKASSSRIACPRENCRRVITLGPTGPVGTAIRAPAGTCRVQCCECQEIFMFNTLNNTPANCPHCRTISSVGTRFKRTRAAFFMILFLLVTSVAVGMLIALVRGTVTGWFPILLSIVAIGCGVFFFYKTVHYTRMKVSQVLGPV